MWSRVGEKNTLGAFARSFEAGFGVEVDVRDQSRTLVVSHDPPGPGALPLRDVLEAHRRSGPGLALALNVKSCGLADAIADVIREFELTDVFVFDMAVPDALDYVRRGVPAYTRVSEHEAVPAFYALASGVWVDCFAGDWIGEEAVAPHLAAGKGVCLVSPELHGRPHEPAWERWARMACVSDPRLHLCTDHPEAARRRFGG